MRIELTTDHAASSYGIPVLSIDGQAYGPADILPEQFQGHGKTAADWAAAEAASGRESLHLARKFCAQNPAGTQVAADLEEDDTI
jgi:hypothetical protein